MDFDAWDTLRIILNGLKGWTVNLDGQDVTLAGFDGDDLLVFDGESVNLADAIASGRTPRRVTEISRIYVY